MAITVTEEADFTTLNVLRGRCLVVAVVGDLDASLVGDDLLCGLSMLESR